MKIVNNVCKAFSTVPDTDIIIASALNKDTQHRK